MKRLIYAEDAMRRIKMETRFYSGTYAEIERAIDSAPTVDPESTFPTAHIMRGTVQSTHDAGFCSNCKLCIDEDYGAALAKSYSYCPYCGARFVCEDGERE